MADTDLTPEELNAIDVLPKFNERPQQKDPTAPAFNPYGFDNNGYLDNQMLQGRMTAIMGVLARRMALSASASALLAHEDAENTKLDRIAAAQSATAAAGSAGTAKANADRAAAAAAGVNLPPVTAANAGKALIVGPDGKYALGDSVPADKTVTPAKLADAVKATASQIEAGSGAGLASVSDVLGVVDNFGTAIGTIVGLLRDAGNRYLRMNGRRYLRSAYPKLAALMRPTIALALDNQPAQAMTNSYVPSDHPSDRNARPVLLGSRLVFVTRNSTDSTPALGRFDLAPSVPTYAHLITMSNTSPVASVKVNETQAVFFYATGSGLFTVTTDGVTASQTQISALPDGGQLAFAILTSAGTWIKASQIAGTRPYRGTGVNSHGTAIASLPSGSIRAMVEYAPGKIAVLYGGSSADTIWISEDDGLTFKNLLTYATTSQHRSASRLFTFAGRLYVQTGAFVPGIAEVNLQNGTLTSVSPSPETSYYPVYAYGHCVVWSASIDNQLILSPDGTARNGRAAVSPYGQRGLGEGNDSGPTPLFTQPSVAFNDIAILPRPSGAITRLRLAYDPSTEFVLPLGGDDEYVRAA